MALALFDLDETLLSTDSDLLWGNFLVKKGIIDEGAYQQAREEMYQAYLAGRFEVEAYLTLCVSHMADLSLLKQHALRDEFLATEIPPVVYPKTPELIRSHQAKGDTCILVTATIHFITAPIAAYLGMDDIIATEVHLDTEGRITSKLKGTPAFQAGKVTRLNAWLKEKPHTMDGATFYSDSHNDIPLLSHVTYPHAVHPDDTLAAHAKASGWPILSLA